jgi:hypothetical protein
MPGHADHSARLRAALQSAHPWGAGSPTPISRRGFRLGVVALVVLSGGLVGCTGTSPEPSLPSSQASSPSSSPPVESAAVPDVVGLSLTKAKSQAEQSGFQVTVEKEYSGERAGTVLSVDPAAAPHYRLARR